MFTCSSQGLGDQIKTLFPNARHQRCAKHISANFYQVFRGDDIDNTFWELAYATTRSDFYMILALLKLQKFLPRRIRNKMMTTASWIEKIPSKKWSRHRFDDYIRCMDNTNNLVKLFNN